MRAVFEPVRTDCNLVERLKEVMVRVMDTFPAACVHDIEGIDEGFPGARVVMSNGADVVVGVDLDQPAELFEVVRMYEPGEISQFDFEAQSANGFASTEKLTAESVMKLLGSYAAASATACATPLQLLTQIPPSTGNHGASWSWMSPHGLHGELPSAAQCGASYALH